MKLNVCLRKLYPGDMYMFASCYLADFDDAEMANK